MRAFVVLCGAALVGLALWRRKQLKSDVERVKATATRAADTLKERLHSAEEQPVAHGSPAVESLAAGSDAEETSTATEAVAGTATETVNAD